MKWRNKQKMNNNLDKNKIPYSLYCDKCPYWKMLGIVKLHRNPPNDNFQKCDIVDCDNDCWSEPFYSCRYNVIKCEYLNYIDEKQESLLYEKCKECGINEMNTDLDYTQNEIHEHDNLNQYKK